MSEGELCYCGCGKTREHVVTSFAESMHIDRAEADALYCRLKARFGNNQ